MTTITNITALPTPPLRSDPTNFAQRADEFLAALPGFQSELNSAGDLIEVAETNAVDAATTAVAARDVALVAQQGAIYAANASTWVSGYSYALDECAIDTVDHQTYRRKSAGASTTTPSADPTNWVKLGLQKEEILDQSNTFSVAQTFTQPIVGKTDSQVSKTGDETIAGIKTFSSSPIVPAGASGSQVARRSEVAPAGLVGMFAMSTAPAGWLKMNGAAVSRTVYADLFSAIGTTFGAGDGSTTFNLPDARGYALRVWDDSAGVDSGRGFGSTQADAIKQSTVNIRPLGSGFAQQWSAPTGEFSVDTTGSTSSYLNFSSSGSGAFSRLSLGAETETRMKNIALLACIKY